jgi:hypothetical protein
MRRIEASVTHAEHQDDLVVVRTYGFRHEAEVGKSMLEANEVDAVISGDDAGGLQPGLGVANRVRLLVRRSDGQKATQLLGSD